jgi:hypothetical protein
VDEEVLDRLELERRDVGQVLDVVPSTVARRHTQHLVVATRLVGHLEHGDRPCLDDAPGEHRLGQQHQRVQRVAVLAERVLDEPVVGRIAKGRVEVAIQLDPAGVVVDLVLVARALRDLDDNVKLHRRGSLSCAVVFSGRSSP